MPINRWFLLIFPLPCLISGVSIVWRFNVQKSLAKPYSDEHYCYKGAHRFPSQARSVSQVASGLAPVKGLEIPVYYAIYECIYLSKNYIVGYIQNVYMHMGLHIHGFTNRFLFGMFLPVARWVHTRPTCNTLALMTTVNRPTLVDGGWLLPINKLHNLSLVNSDWTNSRKPCLQPLLDTCWIGHVQ